MKKILTAVASLSLLASPLAVQAAPQHGGGGGARGQSAVRGGSSAFGGQSAARGGSSAFRGRSTGRAAPAFGGRDVTRGGGYRGGGYRGGYRGYRGGYYPGYDYALGGLGLGLVAGAALADPYYYDYPGYDAPYDYYDGYDYDYPAYGPPAQACGQWIWVPSRGRYVWSAVPC